MLSRSGAMGAIDALNGPVMRMASVPEGQTPYVNDVAALVNAVPEVASAVPVTNKMLDFKNVGKNQRWLRG